MTENTKDFQLKEDQEGGSEEKSEKIDEGDFALPEINFATFIFSLNSSALTQLGLMNDPITGQKTKNLPLAKQTIDIIGMLEEKTRGNLEEDEAQMIKGMLYDLRMLYVKEQQ